MGIADLFWGCPQCGTLVQLKRVRGAAICQICTTRYMQARSSAVRAVGPGGRDPVVRPVAEWLDRIPPIPDPGANAPEAGIAQDAYDIRSTLASVRFVAREQVVRRGREYLNRIERFGPPVTGLLRIEDDALVFVEGDGRSHRWAWDRVAAVQPSSSTLQIRVPGSPVASVRLLGASLRLWEELLTVSIRRHYARTGQGDVLEFQPRIVLARLVVEAPAGSSSPSTSAGPGVARNLSAGSARAHAADAAPGPTLPASPNPVRPASPEPAGRAPRATLDYIAVQRTVVFLWRLLAGLRVEGLDNIPRSGPFILVANHQSALDPILVNAVCPRPLHAMAKSTQFAVPVIGKLMARFYSFPVRRYQVDPQAVRLVLRRLQQGHGVCIYPEGERSWDGRLQPFRRGTLRLLLRAGVPVVPCVLDGSYEAWPRWGGLRLHPIRVAFGEPLRFPLLHDRAQRDAALPSTAERIADAFRALLQGKSGDANRPS